MIEYKRRLGFVRVTADNGVSRDWPLAEFEAAPEACVAATGNGITPPVAEKSETEKLKDLLVTKGVITRGEADAAQVAEVEIGAAFKR